MSKPNTEYRRLLTAQAEKRAEELINFKLMMHRTFASYDQEILDALADQLFKCAMAEAWGELCNEATDRIVELQPPG